MAVESPSGGKPVSMHGIYKLDIAADQTKQLTYCLASPGDRRPDEFTTPEGSRRTLIRLKLLDDFLSQNWAKPSGFRILSSVVEQLPPLSAGAKRSGHRLVQLESAFKLGSSGPFLNVAVSPEMEIADDWFDDTSKAVPIGLIDLR